MGVGSVDDWEESDGSLVIVVDEDICDIALEEDVFVLEKRRVLPFVDEGSPLLVAVEPLWGPGAVLESKADPVSDIAGTIYVTTDCIAPHSRSLPEAELDVVVDDCMCFEHSRKMHASRARTPPMFGFSQVSVGEHLRRSAGYFELKDIHILVA